jgi:hypothetical protein
MGKLFLLFLEVFKMKLMTKEVEQLLPALYSQDAKGNDAIAYVKFFTPDSKWTWYATEYDPKDKMLFGLVIGLDTELGYFSLEDLETGKGPLGLSIERDLYFKPVKK